MIVQDKNLLELIKVIRNLKSDSELQEFFKGILTPKELLEIPLRLQIVKQLKQGKSQREIVESLGVGIATVTRGSKELLLGRFQNV